ncbi:CIA30-domain-containing protein [Rhodotorula sp. JG-1b]|nr:CIA30-domain-containing protein [Rhodotorula sp. JG-1b]
MATSPWRAYLNRSMEHLRDRTAEAMRMDPARNATEALQLLSFRTPEDLEQVALGCDGDVGGKSTVHVDLGPEGKGRFWGKLSNELNPGRRRDGVLEKGGYAGFRNKSRTTLFGTRTWDTSLHEFLCLRVRSAGDGMRYFVNIQTDGPIRTDLFQHRLWLPEPASESDPHSWTDVLIPFSDFALTNSGELSAHQIEMMRQKVRSVGISVLGPKEGRYELGIESISAINADQAEKIGALPPQRGPDGKLLQ